MISPVNPTQFQNPQQTPLNSQFSQVVGETSRIAEWAKGFDKLLEDIDGVACFHEFLKKEYAEENIKFWLACRKYEGITDHKQVDKLTSSPGSY